MINSHRKVDSTRIVFYLNNKGQLHRDDGPAVIYPDGSQAWYKNDEYHRENGPAVIGANGNQFWYKNNQLHRNCGPAIILSNGNQIWYKNGKNSSRK